jgi:hypothetical protein
MTGLHDGSPVPAPMSAKEWADTHRRIDPAAAMPARPIPGPGWLDDDTPCACSRSRVKSLGHYWDGRIADSVLSSDSAMAVYVFDAKA